MSSLQASIAPLSKILGLNPHALYERQLALMRAGLLKSKPGRGPGSGTPLSPETVAVLLISMMASDNISDCAEATSALSAARLTAYSIGQKNILGGAETFKAAMVNALSSDAVVSEITFLCVHRRNFTVEIFTKDHEVREEPPAGKVFSRAELLLDHDNDRLHLFEPKKKRADTFEGMAVVVELRGGTLLGKGGGSPALGKIRALLRSDEVAAAESGPKESPTQIETKGSPKMKRSHGDGAIDTRGENVHRLRYRVGGKRFTKTFHGTLTEARKELRGLVRDGDTGDHIEPTKMTVGQWIDQWIEAGAPGRKKKRVGQRTLERYEELLRVHVKPKLGNRPLQKLAATEIDELYAEREGKIAPMTLHHVHVTFNSCLSTAERKGLLKANPMRRAELLPSGGESDHGDALDEVDLGTLVGGFKPSATMYAPVAVDAATGARRNELLAFRWTDLDVEKKALRVERALEVTKKFGTRFKPPKTKRGLRAIALDDGSLAILLKEKEKHLRIRAGIPDGVEVDLSLVRLPEDALIFPALPEPGEDFSFTTPRNPRNFSKEFARRAKRLGFAGFTFHHLRGTHSTLLLDRGVPVHIVAERIGDDPAVLLRNYAKRKRNTTANNSISADINALAAGFLGK